MLDQSAVCQTSPLLVVEVVSPNLVKRDYRYKRSEYAALEIPEYWIVDPLESKVSVLLWNDGLRSLDSIDVSSENYCKVFAEGISFCGARR
jgi:Uma2 family endonuclease